VDFSWLDLISSKKVGFQLAGFSFQQGSWISLGWILFIARKVDFSWLDLISSKKVGLQLAGFNLQQGSWISLGWI
jgi:hypothetical protein